MVATATGQPQAQPLPDWKDPEWKDSDKILSEVKYDQLPISEVTRDLANLFTKPIRHFIAQRLGRRASKCRRP